MEFEYIPESFKEKEAKYKGHFILDLPKYTQRMKYISQCGFKLKEDGEVDGSMDNLDAIVRMLELAIPHIKTVSVTRLEDQSEFKCVDDLEFDADAGGLLQEVANAVISGVKISKNSKPR
jgi:hypothetical protein